MQRGKTENSLSVVRSVACDIVKQVYEQQQGPEETKTKPNFKRIPSPSAYAKAGASNHQIDLLPHFTEAQAT